MNGILLVDKEQDWTSNDVVAKLKGVLHERRIGHSGTLDPMATGLLVLFVGRATRAVEFAESHSKRYLAGLRLGLSTDTQDITGRVLKSAKAPVSREELLAVLEEFTGEISQIPPMYSAIKVKGQKLYDIARRGGEVERKPRQITVSALTLLGREGEDWLLDVRCSKGTYIRTLCHDIGERLGCGGCMSSLRRIQAGEFTVDRAHTIGQIRQAADEGRAESLLIPVDSLFQEYPALTASAGAEQRLRCGNSVKCEAREGKVRVYSESGEFLLLGQVSGGELKTIKSFFEV